MHDNVSRQFPSTWQTFSALVKNQGYKSLFDGLEFRGLRVLLAVTGMSFADKKLKEVLKKYGY